MSYSPFNVSPKSSPPPRASGDGFKPPEPSWKPPPPPSTATRDVEGKGAWRPSGVPPPPAVAPPSPPTDDDDIPRRRPSPPSSATGTETPPRRSNEIIPMRMFNDPDTRRGRRSHDLPVRPADEPPRPTVLPSSTQWITPHQDDDITPASPRGGAPIIRKPVPSHQSQTRARAQSASQVSQPPPGNRDGLPTFAQSQADYGHANPLHAHPVPEARSYAPAEKMPIDQLLSQDHPDQSFAPPVPVPPPPPAPAPAAPTTYIPVPQAEPSRSLSLDMTRSASIDSPSSAGSVTKGKWFASLGQKTSSGFNNLAQKFGGTGFVPDTLEKECDKAAVILKTFCKEGVYADPVKVTDSPAAPPTEGQHTTASTQKRPQALMTIPTRIINEAVGLAIFTTFRAGLELKFASGSGILVARQHDGSWSPPSAIQLHSFGGGFVAGVDIFDSVCVINSQEALSDFMTKRVSFGGNVAAVAGPWGVGRAVEWGAKMDSNNKGKGKEAVLGSDSNTTLNSPLTPPVLEVNGSRVKVDKETRGKGGAQPKKFQPVYSYIKSRGFYAGVGYDGTVIQERKSANASFYGKVVTCEQILRGLVPPPDDNASLRNLFDVLKGADGGSTTSTSSFDTTISPPVLEEPEEPSILVSEDTASSVNSPSTPMPPAYPADSLHPAEAYAPEKVSRI